MRHYFIIIILNGFLSLPALAQSEESTLFIFIRHAEKDTVELIRVLLHKESKGLKGWLTYLKDEDIEAVFSTPFNRTRETGKIIADSQNVPLIEYNPFKTGVVQELMPQYKEKAVVVVGHFNTVPAYINLLLKKISAYAAF